MANPDHVKKLKDDVNAWNVWRQANPRIVPDLREADLRGTDLSLADLSEAHLSHADLRGADLSEARLSHADLRGAGLTGADLMRPDLRGADLSEANLVGADLRGASPFSRRPSGCPFATARYAMRGGADLSGANLSRTDLRHSYWNGANARHAVFNEAKLLGFRTADCDFTGAQCSRADFRDWLDTEPKWREFAPGEFEKLYGPTFGVEVLFDPEADIRVIAEVVTMLNRRWQQTAHEAFFQFEELTVRPDAAAAFWRTDREAVSEVRQCFEPVLRDVLAAAGLAPSNQTEALIRMGAEALIPRLRELGGGLTLVERREEQREKVAIDMRTYHIEVSGQVGVFNVADIINAETIAQHVAGRDLVKSLVQVQDESDFKERLEQLEKEVQQLSSEDQELVIRQIQSAFEEQKPTLTSEVLAYFQDVLATATGGLIAAALKHGLGL